MKALCILYNASLPIQLQRAQNECNGQISVLQEGLLHFYDRFEPFSQPILG